MRTLTRILLASSGAAIGLAPAVAAAQNDVTPHLPNVLLLIDTSGSMEQLMIPDPSDPTGLTPMTPESAHAPAGAQCTARQSAAADQRKRGGMACPQGRDSDGDGGADTDCRERVG